MNIVDLTQSKSALEVTWEDRRRSSFLYLWLRDNCTCRECGTTRTGARLLRLTDVPADIRPLELAMDERGRVAVQWSHGGHRSTYDPHWLREHCSRISRRHRIRRRPWDHGKSKSVPRLDYPLLAGDEKAPIAVLEQLFETGFVLLDRVPLAEESTEEIAALLGPIRAQSYAPIFDIWPRDNPEVLSNTEAPLAPHVDEPFQGAPPGVFLLHCVKANSDGGANVLVDGFMLAKVLKRHDPDAFRTLCEVPIPHHRCREGEFHHYFESPVFSLDAYGDVIAFRFAERSAAPLKLPAKLMRRVYAARRALLALAYDPAYQVRVRLAPGQGLLIDNHRLMHGRDAFKGDRHLRQCNIDRDAVLSLYRLRCHRTGHRPVV